MQVSIKVNGQNYTRDIEERTLLVHFLREHAGLTGTHIGCETSLCGACTVLLNGNAVKSCTVLAASVDGLEVTTVEGLAKGSELHPIQEGFWEEHGLQCGFCTPGFLMATVQLLERTPNPSEDEIRHGLECNYCPCTGYHNIVKSGQYAAAKMRGEAVAAD